MSVDASFLIKGKISFKASHNEELKTLPAPQIKKMSRASSILISGDDFFVNEPVKVDGTFEM